MWGGYMRWIFIIQNGEGKDKGEETRVAPLERGKEERCRLYEMESSSSWRAKPKWLYAMELGPLVTTKKTSIKFWTLGLMCLKGLT